LEIFRPGNLKSALGTLQITKKLPKYKALFR
jgi:hypothetical protein